MQNRKNRSILSKKEDEDQNNFEVIPEQAEEEHEEPLKSDHLPTKFVLPRYFYTANILHEFDLQQVKSIKQITHEDATALYFEIAYPKSNALIKVGSENDQKISVDTYDLNNLRVMSIVDESKGIVLCKQ